MKSKHATGKRSVNKRVKRKSRPLQQGAGEQVTAAEQVAEGDNKAMSAGHAEEMTEKAGSTGEVKPETEQGVAQTVEEKVVVSRCPKLPRKVSAVLLKELSEKEDCKYENEKEAEHDDSHGVGAAVAVRGRRNIHWNFKHHQKFYLKWAAVLVVCIVVLLYNCPSLGIERYLTSRQTTRLERLVNNRDYQRGLAYLDEIREGREGDYQYWMFRGVCNAGLEYNREEAEQNFLRALSLCREQRETYEVKYYLAALLNDLGRYDETRDICMEALSRVRHWKSGARERYEALLNRSDLNQEAQKLQEGQSRGDWLKESVPTQDTMRPNVPVIVPDTALLAVVSDSVATVPHRDENLAALEESAREMIREMERQGKKVEDLDKLLPVYDSVKHQRGEQILTPEVAKKEEKKVKLPPSPRKLKESEADRVRWIRDMKLVIGKDTLVIIQGSDSLIAVVKRIAKVEQEKDGDLVYVIPDDEIVEVDGLEKLLDKKVTVMVYEVFDFNKVYMNNRGHLFMDKLVSLLDSRPDIQLEVAVHCDGIGTREVNHRVAEMRMVGIRDRLNKRDIPTGRIHFEICGSDRPRQITAREAQLYPFLKVGDVLTMEFLRGLTQEQRRLGHILNRRVEIRKMN